MKKPNKYLYIYLKNILTNPHLQFDLHLESVPDKRASFAKTSFISLEKNLALDAVERVEDMGFWALTRLLLERDLKKNNPYAMIVYADFDEPAIIIDEWPHKDYEGGEFHTFLPLRPFPKNLNTDENSLDPVLHMRAGRIILNALLD